MKTESSSFRLEKDVFTEFKKHADKQNITTNSLINKVMKEYVEWGALIPAINLIPISATLIATFLKNHTEEQIRNIAREHAGIHMEENLLIVKNEASVDSFLQGVQRWCNSAGFPLSIREGGDSTKYTIMHKQGTKFSILIEETIKTSIEILTEKNSSIEILTEKKTSIKHTTNSVSFCI
jgi:predicted DNA-binding ribbon-helix-helix protein